MPTKKTPTAKLILGDCLAEMARLPGDGVELVLTDIPYGEAEAFHGRAHDGEWRARFSADKRRADTVTFPLPEFVAGCLRVCSGSFYVFCGVTQVSALTRLFRDAGLSTRHCIWKKTNPAPTNGQHLWLPAFENCVYAKKPGAAFNEHCEPGVWQYPVGRARLHPTQKPLDLFERLILASSDPGDTVLDPCLGSGTTAIAALRTGRSCIGIEQDPAYLKIARSRMEGIQMPLDA